MSDKKLNGEVGVEIPDGGAARYHPDETISPGGDDHGLDSSEVRFLNGGKDLEADKDFEKKDPNEFVGLRKEELAKYASDPYWVRLRIILLVIFALTWVAMLVAAIVIVFAPGSKCPPRPDQKWYEKGVMYQIYPRSFQDSKSDGDGDIKGIHERLGYLKDKLKVSALLLGPMYPSPIESFGYDVINFKAVCPGHYGTMTDFENLRIAVHKAGLKLVLDFVPNHTSRKHRWFVESSNSTSTKPEYRDYYIWKDGRSQAGGAPLPPNDWQSVQGGPAWEWHADRKQFYYHTYSKNEPDLNLRNEAVKQELADALTFWLDKKVDGFRLLGVQHLLEPRDVNENSAAFQPESYRLVADWRKLINDFSANDRQSRSRYTARVLIADVDGTPSQTVQFSRYEEGGEILDGAHLVTNKVLTRVGSSCSSSCIRDLIAEWTSVAVNVTSNWQVGNADTSRVVSRFGGDTRYINAVNLLLLTLDGPALIFYGDELGMRDAIKATSGRSQLTPMQWSNQGNAGFTNASVQPWMALADNYNETNFATQQAHGSGVNHVGVFSRLVELRRTSESLQWGRLYGVAVEGGVLLYIREAQGFPRLLVAINFGQASATISLESYQRKNLGSKQLLPHEMKIESTTDNFSGRDGLFSNGTVIKLDKMIFLKPAEGIVLSWLPSADRCQAGTDDIQETEQKCHGIVSAEA